MISIDTTRAERHLDRGALSKEVERAGTMLESLKKGTCAGSEMLGWLRLPFIDRKELERIVDTAKRIQDDSDALVVIGIGGSYLGAESAVRALPLESSFEVLFAGTNLSPEYHSRILEGLEGKKFSICVISKSGTTTEPAVAFRIFREALIEKVGKEGLAGRIVAITDPKHGALRSAAVKERYTTFDIPPDVGGRFSVLSPVGLLPMAAAGIPVGDILEGARWSIERFSAVEPNDMLRYAAVRHLLHEGGTDIEVMSTFHPELSYVCEWWKQLAGESEGKNGKGLFPASTVMTRDLHSLGQYLQEGKRNILETFLVAGESRKKLVIPYDDDDLDGLNYLAGRGLFEVNRKAFEGTRDAHSSGGLPVTTIEIERIDPFNLGALYVLFELSVAVSALLLGVNPFDQPGVEEYKNRMYTLLGKPGFQAT